MAQGGKAVFGCRTAYKDMNGHCVMDKLPGLLQPLTQADVVEYSFIAPDTPKVTVDWQGTVLEASVFTDLLEALPGGELEGTYTSDYYAGSGAIVSHEFGQGKAWYYGSAFSEQAARVFLEKLGCISPWADTLELPETCELAVRSGENGTFLFVLNYMKEPARISIKKPCVNMADGAVLSGSMELPGYGVLVLKA